MATGIALARRGATASGAAPLPGYLLFPTSSTTTKATSPDSAALSMVNSDMDVRVKLALDDWTPAAEQKVISKHGANGYILAVTAAGAISWDVKGPAGDRVHLSSASVPAADGVAIWIRAAFTYNFSGTDSSTAFYTSTDGTTWTALGTPTSVVKSGPSDGTEQLTIGVYSDGASGRMRGKLYRVQLRNNILDDGTGIAFDATFDGTVGPFTESSSNAAIVTVTA